MKGWLYSIDEPDGKVFEGPEYTLKTKDGWVDSPALLHNQEPAEKPKGKPGPKPKGSRL